MLMLIFLSMIQVDVNFSECETSECKFLRVIQESGQLCLVVSKCTRVICL